MLYFTVSSSNPAPEAPNGRSLGGCMSSWLFNLRSFLPIHKVFFHPLLLLFYQSMILEHMEFNQHLNPEGNCLNEFMGICEVWRRGIRRARRPLAFAFFRPRSHFDIIHLALEGSGILAKQLWEAQSRQQPGTKESS